MFPKEFETLCVGRFHSEMHDFIIGGKLFLTKLDGKKILEVIRYSSRKFEFVFLLYTQVQFSVSTFKVKSLKVGFSLKTVYSQ